MRKAEVLTGVLALGGPTELGDWRIYSLLVSKLCMNAVSKEEFTYL